MRRIIFPVLMGLVGVGILVSLCLWQLERLDWKRSILDQIDAKISAAPVPLPASATEASDEYLAVDLRGTPTGQEIHVLSSGTVGGTGYRVISAFVTDDGRRVMLDQGILPLMDDSAPKTTAIEAQGNLLWPDDKTSSTPEPDLAKNIWFARDVPAMAEALGTEPVFLIARSPTGDGIDPMPVTRDGIPNNHWQYAVTWYLLAICWLGMTALLLWRIRQRNE